MNSIQGKIMKGFFFQGCQVFLNKSKTKIVQAHKPISFIPMVVGRNLYIYLSGKYKRSFGANLSFHTGEYIFVKKQTELNPCPIYTGQYQRLIW